MSWNGNKTDGGLDPATDVALEQALRDFRESVHAWSDAAYGRPKAAARFQGHRGWRLAVAWALGGVLVTGALSGGVYEHQQRTLAAKRALEAAAIKAREAGAQQPAQLSDEDLLATVDSDVSRTVPAAMEPLAQLMDSQDQGEQ